MKVKNSRELKRYLSQNISSHSWNSTVNKVAFWLNLYSARLCCICLIDKLLSLLVIKSFSRKCDKVCFPLVVKRFIYTTEAKIENDLIRSRCFMNQFNIELDWKFTLSLTPTLAWS